MKKRAVRPKASADPPKVATDDDVTWASVDPRNGSVVEYEATTSKAIERAFQSGEKTFDLLLGGNPFQIVFSSMQQRNASGGSRRVVRRAPLNFSPPVPFVSADVDLILKTVAEVDAAVADLEKHEEERTFRLNLSGIDVAPIVDALNRIIQGFKIERYRNKYGFNGDADADCMSLELRNPVPNYFANVTDSSSIYRRKMLSLCGLRNLVVYGPEIFEEMRSRLFSGALDDYGPKEGPNKMRYFTGNAVDLDYVVLRCNDSAVLAAVNAQQRKQGGPTFASAKELAGSETGRNIAITASKELIDQFVARFKLSPSEVKRRRLDLTECSHDIHVATGNSDRGHHPIWHYSNVGQSSFHANVPNMSDVYGALLKAPFHLAKAIALVFARHAIGSPEFIKAMDEFYEDAVADSCFNAKWKAIEEFVSTIDAKGTIPVVLAELQAKNQTLFPGELYANDPDGKKELEVMTKLAFGVVARDPQTGASRKITQEDVAAWLKSVADVS